MGKSKNHQCLLDILSYRKQLQGYKAIIVRRLSAANAWIFIESCSNYHCWALNNEYSQCHCSYPTQAARLLPSKPPQATQAAQNSVAWLTYTAIRKDLVNTKQGVVVCVLGQVRAFPGAVGTKHFYPLKSDQIKHVIYIVSGYLENGFCRILATKPWHRVITNLYFICRKYK